LTDDHTSEEQEPPSGFWRNYSDRWSKSYVISKRSAIPSLCGGIAFLLATVIQPMIFPLPELLKSTEVPLNIVTAVDVFFGGSFIAFCVCYYCILYSKRIAPNNVIIRSITYAFFALLIETGLLTLLNLNDALSYFLVSAALSVPRYLLLGLVVGLVYQRTSTWRQLISRPKRRAMAYYVLIVVTIIVASVVFNFYAQRSQPVSFTASDIHFVTSDGIVTTIANVTNTSGPSLIQVDAAIDGMDDGICGYGIQTNQTMECKFYSPSGGLPPLYCIDLVQAENYTLTLNAYFANTKTVINTYVVSRAQLGCSQLAVPLG
jgi:hypothetical protein